MKTISLVGYSDSGKTTVASAIIAEATRRGLRTAAVKVGHPAAEGGPEGAAGRKTRDTDRLLQAGADPVAFRTPGGWQVQVHDPAPQSMEIPRWLQAMMEDVDLLVVEGRRIAGAFVVQTVGHDGRRKVEDFDLLIENAPAEPLPPELLEVIGG
ncbi:MAG: hypothetical protein EA427_10875 [Spirochaetaceae bacterium]|nr:MAG: hypothetical protein EA427_10875 [Spirochaetaceae bacterium]